MKVYVAEYSPLIFESGFEVISIHKTKEGAEKALEKHKKKNSKFGVMYKEWRVNNYQVKED